MPSWITPTLIDIVFAVLAIGFITGGYRAGFAKAAGNFLSLVIGLVASYFATKYAQSSGFLAPFLTNPWVLVGFFVGVLLLIAKIVDLIFGAVDLVQKFFSIIPGFGLLTCVLGAVIGLVQAAAVILTITYINVHLLTGSWHDLLTATRTITFILTKIAPFIPGF